MDGKVPSSGKRSGKKRRKSKTHRDRKRETKSKLNVCNDLGLDETNSDSVLYSSSRQSSKKPVRLGQTQSITSSKAASTSEVRLGHGENSSRTSQNQNETQRLTDLISAIFSAADGSETVISAHRSEENETQSLSPSPESSVELMDLTGRVSESLRWEESCSDPEEERERIRKYKINRQKRYLVELLRTRQDKESVLTFARDLAASYNDLEF